MHTQDKGRVDKWRVDKVESNLPTQIYIFANNESEWVCKFPESYNAEANAKRIVQAVNSFDDLLETCKIVEEYLNRDNNSSMFGEILKEAIAKAEKPE